MNYDARDAMHPLNPDNLRWNLKFTCFVLLVILPLLSLIGWSPVQEYVLHKPVGEFERVLQSISGIPYLLDLMDPLPAVTLTLGTMTLGIIGMAIALFTYSYMMLLDLVSHITRYERQMVRY